MASKKSMSKKFLFIIFALCVHTGKAQTFSKLIWSDEFNYEGLPDPKKWGYEEGMVRNNEAQYFTKARIENAHVHKGVLTIEARKEDFKEAKYTSASLITADTKTFTYGRVEIRAKIPMGRGTWPALWTLGSNFREVSWPQCGEIDILENVGFDSLKIHGNIHTEAYNHVLKTNKGNTITVHNPWEDFHVYAVEWYADHIDIFFDDQLYFTYRKESNATNATWPFDKPQYLILNLAIGGAWGGTKGIDNTKFPHQLLIDYVRVYQ